MSPSPRASTAWPGLSTGQLAATPASAAAPGLGHGVCIRTPGFLGNSALTTGPPQRAGGCAGEQSHAPHPCSRCLLHSFRLKQHRDACCTLQERARHPIPPCRKSPQNTSSPFEQAHITFQPEEQHSLCRQGPSRKPLWQGHPYHLSQHRVPQLHPAVQPAVQQVCLPLRRPMAESWERVGLFLSPILALNATCKGHTCTKGRGWNTCRPANCPDCSTMFVQLGTHMYVPQHTWGGGADREMQERGGSRVAAPTSCPPHCPLPARTVEEMQRAAEHSSKIINTRASSSKRWALYLNHG